MSDSQPTSPSNFFAVSWGQQRGVYTSYKEAQAAMKGFPSPVYKKFKNREEAEEFVKKCQPESTSIEADENDQKFYAVARGRIIGIFKDMETVKKHTKGYPNSMHKKFDSINEAKQYLEKFSEGKVEEKKASPKKQKEQPAPVEAQAQVDGKMDGEEEQQEEVEAKATETPTKPVGGSQSGNLAPRKRTYETKVADAEEETGEKKVAEETIAEVKEEEKKKEEKMEEEGEEKEKKEEEKVNGEEEKEGIKEEKMDAEEEKEEEGEEPSQKKTKLEEEVEKKAKLNDEEEEVKEKSGEQDQAQP